MPTRRPHPGAFSLVELVIVVAIIGIIGAIAIPRLGGGAARSKAAAVHANLRILTQAIEHYAAEHGDRSPAQAAGGAVSTDPDLFMSRLIGSTSESGMVSGSGIFGPYLRAIPPNPYNNRTTIRIDGAAPGANTHGWHFNSTTRVVSADHKTAVAGGGALSETAGNDLEATATPGGSDDKK